MKKVLGCRDIWFVIYMRKDKLKVLRVKCEESLGLGCRDI